NCAAAEQRFAGGTPATTESPCGASYVLAKKPALRPAFSRADRELASCVASSQVRTFTLTNHGRGGGVGRGLGVGVCLGVEVAVGVGLGGTVTVAVAVGVAVGV